MNTDPAYTGLAVDISITDHTFSTPCRAIYVGGAGNIVVKGTDGVNYTLTGVLAGSIYPVQAKAIVKTNTTASNMVALF